jgi:hypothetical protein
MSEAMQSNLSPAQYHEYSDAIMNALLDSLESLLDETSEPQNEIEYSASPFHVYS